MIIGVKYEMMHIGFTYPSIMKAFQNHCIEKIGKEFYDYRIVIKFLWGIKIFEIDSLLKELESLHLLLKKPENINLSEQSIIYLDENERVDFEQKNKNIFLFFCALETNNFFIDVFKSEIQNAMKDESPFVAIGSMAVRPDMVEEYGWDWPTKIPDEIKNL
jgi:hypothetical protein